jgi:hypothetical protein
MMWVTGLHKNSPVFFWSAIRSLVPQAQADPIVGQKKRMTDFLPVALISRPGKFLS